MLLPKKAKHVEIEDNKSDFTETEKLLKIENELCNNLESLEFTSPIEYIYNPLRYAKNLHEIFIKKYFEKSFKKILFLGINPGPWGMCQTGIAFGEIDYVKEWFEITGSVEKPIKEHPKKKVTGLDCCRREVSGKRLWSFFKKLCGSPENFFRYSFVYNLCPLAFMDVSGKNITPPEIKNKTIRDNLNRFCDDAFISILKEFNFEIVIGIGDFAKKRAEKALKLQGITNIEVYLIPHPSPRNVKNGSKWEEKAFSVLHNHNLVKYFNENCDKNLFTTSTMTQNNSVVEDFRFHKWMKIALGFAEEALKNGEVPVGCIFIYNNEIIAKGANTVNETKNATRHAEMNCIDEVLNWCDKKNLEYKQVFKEIEVIVTVEPCIMCSAALHELNIKHIIYGCGNYRFGGCSSVFKVPSVYEKSSCKVIGGIYSEESINLLKEFYKGTNPNAPKSKVKIKKP